jgi:tRNA-dihydrouridine synthase
MKPGATACLSRGVPGESLDLYQQINELLKGEKEVPLPGAEEVADVMTGHLDSCIDFYGLRNGIVIFHKFFAWYTKGFRRIRPLREKAFRSKTKEEITASINAVRTLKRLQHF